uniref:Uncharacterized protein n=1 Tax=viral metagenome TaxID=1070528 RepID=A0A6M3LGD8_9ZZZZ
MNDNEHIHDWETIPVWGVVIGVSRCKVCGKLSQSTDFAYGAKEATRKQTHAGSAGQAGAAVGELLK